MAGYRRPWWVAGGWALDLLLGAKTRPHADLEISMLAADQQALFRHLRGWDLRLAAPGQSLPRWDGRRIQPPFHQIWARRRPGGSSTAEEFAADPAMLGFLLEQHAGNRWMFRAGTQRSPGRYTSSACGPRAACRSWRRRSRCCSRPRHPGSRTSGTSTVPSPTWTGPPGAGWRRPCSRPIPATPGTAG
jgi:hypothetical protein